MLSLAERIINSFFSYASPNLWEHHDGTVISVACRQFKMKSTLFFCMQMYSLRRQFADLFHDLPLAHKFTVSQTGAFYFSQACSEDVFIFFQKQTNDSYRFISELMDVFFMAGVHQQPEQSNYLAKGQLVNFSVEDPYILHASPSQTVYDTFLNGTTNSAISSQTLWTFLWLAKTSTKPITPNDQAPNPAWMGSGYSSRRRGT